MMKDDFNCIKLVKMNKTFFPHCPSFSRNKSALKGWNWLELKDTSPWQMTSHGPGPQQMLTCANWKVFYLLSFGEFVLK